MKAKAFHDPAQLAEPDFYAGVDEGLDVDRIAATFEDVDVIGGPPWRTRARRRPRFRPSPSRDGG